MILEEDDLPIPDCCEESLQSGLVRMSMPDTYWAGQLDDAPVWRIAHCSFDIEVSFCPFGGHPLPKVQLRYPPVSPVCRFTPGDSYMCAACGKAAHSCDCHPPEDAWEIAKR